LKQPTDPSIFIGVMTGTSIDGLDIAAIRVCAPGSTTSDIELVAAAEYPLPAQLRTQIEQLARNDTLSWRNFGAVDAALGDLTGTLVEEFLAANKIPKDSVAAIGSHGQTVHHSPGSAW